MTRILLCASGSVAVYKACEVASTLAQNGHEVRTAMTAAAARLVHPQLFEALTGQSAQTSEWTAERRSAMDHIDLSQWAECVLVAPATADLIGRIALGLGDDLVTTTLLAVAPGVPRMLCPAMNPNMLAQPAVVRNLTTLREDGWEVLEPDEGHMACGVSGKGRLAAPAAIVDRVSEILKS